MFCVVISILVVFVICLGECLHTPSVPSVWKVFSDLADKTQACNLGHGFPDWECPPFVLKSLKDATNHQYTRPAGYPPLTEMLAQRYSEHLETRVDPNENVAITVGASQALYLALRSILSSSDEIILFDPFFELYTKQIRLTGAKPVFVPLGSSILNPWALDIEALRRSITSKTKLILLNSPHNPTGKVFTLAELQAVASVVRENPHVMVISDEVYKYTVYNALSSPGDPAGAPVGHHHFARLPGMWDRTLTISSAGKTFSVTGWQIGWMVGPRQFIEPVQALLPCVQFCAPTPLQQALSIALPLADAPYEEHISYYEWLRSQFKHKRAILEKGLREVGIESLPSSGGFFLMGRLPEVHEAKLQLTDEPYDWKYCRFLAERYGVIGIPASPFYSRADYASHYGTGPLARFAFCKRDDTLLEAARRLGAGQRDYLSPQAR